MTISYIAPRTVVEVQSNLNDANPRALEALRQLHSYVLLGDPGSGKTTAFTAEAAEPNCVCLNVDVFVNCLEIPGTLQGKTLFIDGLDETRAGLTDGTSTFADLRSRLVELGRPRFRLSCRAADWLGQSDEERLRLATPNGSSFGVFQLEPLTLTDAKAILRKNHHVTDPRAFIKRAQDNQLDGLLLNPQMLKLLANAIGADGAWPDSRRSVYGLAVEKLLAEHNTHHQKAKHKTWPNLAGLADAAGYLSCLNLMADVRDFAKFGTHDVHTAVLNMLNPNPALKLQEVIETRVFASIDGETFAPVHRTIAEYLAAQYLARRIKVNLPVGRVLAMLQGADGGIFTPLRGLHAWLAVYASEARTLCIDADPIGVVLYGDVSGFSVTEKQKILANIRAMAKFSSAVIWQKWDSATWSGLATHDMTAVLKAALLADVSIEENRILASVVLKALEAASAIPALSETLLELVRKSTWPEYLRGFALKVALKHFGPKGAQLQMFLDDIQSGAVVDSEDELLGKLLTQFYPGVLSIEAALAHFHPRKNEHFLGSYWRFWHDRFLEKTTDEMLPELCIALAKTQATTTIGHRDIFWALSSAAAARTLVLHGDKVNDGTVFSWLGLCLDKNTHSYLEGKDKPLIHAWFEKRPLRYKAIFKVGLSLLAGQRHLSYKAMARLHEAPKPSDFNEWLFEQALAEKNIANKENYFERLFAISADTLARWQAKSPEHAAYVVTKSIVGAEQQAMRAEDAHHLAGAARKKEAELTIISADVPQMLKNKGRSDLLYVLALVLHKNVHDENRAPQQELGEFLGGDKVLQDAVNYALSNAMFRDDLPSANEIIALNTSQKRHFLMPAIVVSCERIHLEAPQKLLSLTDKQISTAIASFYAYSAETQMSSAWVETLAQHRPQLVADVCVLNAIAHFKKRGVNPRGLYMLAYEPCFAAVAKLAVLPLLSGFPPRALLAQLPMLECVLKAAIKQVEPVELLAVVRRKLTAKTLEPMPRTYWLGAALVLDEAAFLPRLGEHVANFPERVHHLSLFLGDRASSRCSFNFTDATVAGLVQIFGINAHPGSMTESGLVNSIMDDSWRVRAWIGQLANSPNGAATVLLRGLETSSALQHWVEFTRDAIAAQAATLRDASFKVPTAKDVETILNMGMPISVADVAAIVNEVLMDISEELRNDLDFYKQFWNVDSHGRPLEPRVENICRDSLATHLRLRLGKYEIQVSTENKHAEQKRSDIWCDFAAFGVPIEAKVESNGEVWTALERQLIAKYASDPRTSGFGIYLVFWFGGGLKKSPTTGAKPTTPKELAERLAALIPLTHRALVNVHVLDCSKILKLIG